MGKFIIGLVLGVVLVPAAVYFYMSSGNAPVATSAQPMPFERFLAHTAMHATIERQEKPIHLAKPTDASLEAGAKLYRTDCAVCHGLPGEQPTATARGMFPPPPQFFRPHARKIDDPAGEVYWKVENGLRLTGMPGWHGSLSDAQVREITSLLENAVSLPAPVTAVLKGSEANTKAKAKAKPSHRRS